MHRLGWLLIPIAILIAWLLLRGGGGVEKSVAPAVPVAMAPRAGEAPSVSVAPAPRPERREDEHEAPAIAPPSPFPPGSQPLTEGTDPALSVAEDNPVDAESGIHVVFGPRRDVVHPPDPIVLDLVVYDRDGHALPIGNPRAYFRGERDTEATGTGAHVAFTDAGKHQYVATFAPTPAEQKSIMRFRTFVEVAFDAPDKLGERHYSASVQYTPSPHAVLDGEWRDAMDNGALVVQAGVEAAQPGQYKVIASLYAGDTAIAFAQNSAPLPAGRGFVPLTFFGKILYDKALPGPYEVRFAMLFEEFPAEGIYWPGATVDHAYRTGPYAASDFSPQPYMEPPREGEVNGQSPSQQGRPGPLFTR
jgi:hypothetical protein